MNGNSISFWDDVWATKITLMRDFLVLDHHCKQPCISALNGLKQSSRAWFHKLSTVLLEFGFFGSPYDPSLFISHQHGHITIMLVYVDHIIITGSNSQLVTSCIAHLQSQFALKDLGYLNFFLGI